MTVQIILPELVTWLQIDFIAHDALPYPVSKTTSDDEDNYGKFRSVDMFVETKRTENISTSDLVVRVLKESKKYVDRSLSNGFTLEDLNLDNNNSD